MITNKIIPNKSFLFNFRVQIKHIKISKVKKFFIFVIFINIY